MSRTTLLLLAMCLILGTTTATAELENVQVGGELRIKSDWIINWAVEPGPFEVRVPASLLPRRPIGEFVSGAPAFNGLGLVSPYAFDDKTNDLFLIEQRTKLNVKADFTNDVSAFIELESYDFWGEDFRSNYVTGVDSRANSSDDVEVYQAYIEAANMWGTPLQVRIGRQELAFGSQWLVGPKDFGPFYRGRSFDALRLTYPGESFRVDAWASTLAESGISEQDGDVWFYGIYATCTAIENITFDAYWMWIRDARSLNDTNFVAPIEWLEDVFNVDDYDTTNLHTVGLRAAGALGAFDFDVEGAYQFGDADQVGFGFKPFLYGDDSADFDAWGVTAEAGYTFDIVWNPRVFLKYSFYQGEDNRDLAFGDWINPFYRPESSVSFNRLFSNDMYNGFWDLQNDFSNGHAFTLGAIAHPSESLDLIADVNYYLVDEPFDSPAYFTVGSWRIPLAPALSFWTEEGDDELGWTTDIMLVYHYSEDLMFSLHWCHLFAGDAIEDGAFFANNGLVFGGGSDKDDGEFITFETRICF
ncbi:MAG: alginate export family protein [Candidatus Hydrogenedentes bacterium]|nr:alginate export family protein [Candidatus Hydrogenedentota bacterium]